MAEDQEGGSGPLQSRGRTPYLYLETHTHTPSPLPTFSSTTLTLSLYSPTVNSTLRNLSNLYREQGQLDKAEELDRLTQQKVLTPDPHPLFSVLGTNLSLCISSVSNIARELCECSSNVPSNITLLILSLVTFLISSQV